MTTLQPPLHTTDADTWLVYSDSREDDGDLDGATWARKVAAAMRGGRRLVLCAYDDTDDGGMLRDPPARYHSVIVGTHNWPLRWEWWRLAWHTRSEAMAACNPLHTRRDIDEEVVETSPEELTGLPDDVARAFFDRAAELGPYTYAKRGDQVRVPMTCPACVSGDLLAVLSDDLTVSAVRCPVYGGTVGREHAVALDAARAWVLDNVREAR